MTSHISMRGEIIDFNKLRLDNADQVPLGNAPVNAKGDLVNEEGIVLKSEEQLEAEYQARVAANSEPTRSVDIKNTESIVSAVSEPKVVASVKQLDVDDANFDPLSQDTPVVAPVSKSRRKIVESEE